MSCNSQASACSPLLPLQSESTRLGISGEVNGPPGPANGPSQQAPAHTAVTCIAARAGLCDMFMGKRKQVAHVDQTWCSKLPQVNSLMAPLLHWQRSGQFGSFHSAGILRLPVQISEIPRPRRPVVLEA